MTSAAQLAATLHEAALRRKRSAEVASIDTALVAFGYERTETETPSQEAA